MKYFNILIAVFLIGIQSLFSIPDFKLLNGINSQLTKTAIENDNNLNSNIYQRNGTSLNPNSGISQIMKKYESFNLDFQNRNFPKNELLSKDTLFIGMKVNDSLVITGDWVYNGTIVVVLDGKVIFRNANATIFGDIILMHNGILKVKDSKIYLPQQYFYQRTIMGVGNSQFIAENSSFDYSGLSHNLVLMDSTKFIFKKLKVNGFTTTGLYGKPTFNIDDINEAGEFVIMDSTDLSIKNSKTALIWHVIPKNGKMDIKFPKGDTLVPSYICNKTVSGISGLNYSINIQNTSNVMWGLMPQSGSDITVKDSHIRAIGLWYIGNDYEKVSSLVNNSLYQDFNLPGAGRNLHLINSFVDTWSIYCFNNSDVSLSSSIVGEIGCMGRSKMMASQMFCDGTGGYLFANDTSFMVYGFGAASSSIRSSGNSIFLFGYSAISTGQADAFGNSVMMIVQSTLPEEPVAHNSSSLWFANIEQPIIRTVNSKIPLIGTASIDEGPDGNPIKFSNYSIYYKASTELLWHPIMENVKKSKRRDTLAIWDTKSLLPDNYSIKLVLYSNFKDSIEAIKNINIQPIIANVMENQDENVQIYPNPAKDFINILIKNELYIFKAVDIIDSHGNILFSEQFINNMRINISNWYNGNYFVKMKSEHGEIIRKIEICR